MGNGDKFSSPVGTPHSWSGERVATGRHPRLCKQETPKSFRHSSDCQDTPDRAKMPSEFFKNRRVYLLTTVAYTGSLLFGESISGARSVI